MQPDGDRREWSYWGGDECTNENVEEITLIPPGADEKRANESKVEGGEEERQRNGSRDVPEKRAS